MKDDECLSGKEDNPGDLPPVIPEFLLLVFLIPRLKENVEVSFAPKK